MDRAPGRATWHSFSFGAHYDPANVGFGPMVCHDEHLLAAGQGFETHQHAGLVIVTWVVSGALTHSDSSGDTATVLPGSVGVLNAGSGVEHSEIAAAPQTRFVQVWLRPEDADPDAVPTYEVRPVGLAAGGGFADVAEPLTGATFRVARLAAGESVTLPAATRQHLFVASGALQRFGLTEPLAQGDALRLEGETDTTVTAAVPTELLLWSFTT